MTNRRLLFTSTIMGGIGVLAGVVIGAVPSVWAQRIDPAFSTGTFQISAGNQNEAWRVNTSTGETYYCVGARAAVNCVRAEFK